MIKFAIVGYGYIGKKHAEMIQANQASELVAVCDIRQREELAIDNDRLPYFDTIEKLLQAKLEIDVVCICTPNGLHAKQAEKVLEANKHVVIEKPIALRKNDAEKLIFKSIELSRHVFCVMQNRFSPPSLWLRELMDKKTLGDIYIVKLDCFWNRDERYYTKGNWHGDKKLDGGTLFTQFSHFIDIMYWLFGDIKNIRANFADFNHEELSDFEDSGLITFDFLKGGMGCLNYSTAIWNKNMESSITIIGEKGSVKVAGQYMNEIAYCHIKDYNMPELPPASPPNDYGTHKGSAQNHHYVIQNVVQTLLKKEPIRTNALEGMKVVDIIERIYALRDKQWKKK